MDAKAVLKDQRDRALALLIAEHQMHHADCCVDPADLCHVGELVAEVRAHDAENPQKSWDGALKIPAAVYRGVLDK